MVVISHILSINISVNSQQAAKIGSQLPLSGKMTFESRERMGRFMPSVDTKIDASFPVKDQLNEANQRVYNQFEGAHYRKMMQGGGPLNDDDVDTPKFHDETPSMPINGSMHQPFNISQATRRSAVPDSNSNKSMPRFLSQVFRTYSWPDITFKAPSLQSTRSQAPILSVSESSCTW